MKYAHSRPAALAEALRRTLGRPVRFALVTGSICLVLSLLAIVGLALWRLAPAEAPQWMHPQALVLVAGAEGETDLAATRSALRQVAAVASVDFFGRDAALAELAQRKALASIGLNELRPNPLPDGFVVRFSAGVVPDAVEAAVGELRKVKNVDRVEYAAEPYRRLFGLSQLATRLLLLLGGFLAAALVIGIALAATFWDRLDGDEIRVLGLLGADPSAIRRPHVYAGALTLAVAAALAWWLLAGVAGWLEPLAADLARQYSVHWASNPLPPWSGAALCAGAAALGGLVASAASRLAMRRSER